MMSLSVAIAQLNFTVGDVEANLQKILRAVDEARTKLGCRAIVFPELAITGYPPEDLLLRSDFLDETEQAVRNLTASTGDIFVVIGHPIRESHSLYNAASVLHQGKVVATYYKRELPNFGVFDEKRYFAAGASPCVVDIDGVSVGLTICEDIWHTGPAADSVRAGAEVIFNLN
ncbi:MAG: NAD+ synthase, partial [Gammaproteobacteria bacterium]|nr:NAD+ synthase [Gammaproteobacteria bacterium]